MQSAATRLVGEHDFRNLSKLDSGKQITNFRRRIMRTQIILVDSDGDGENWDPPLPPSPSRTPPDSQSPSPSPLPLVNRKPEYQMTDALLLMLWDCAYASSDVSRQIDVDDSDSNSTETESGTGSDLYHQLHSIHQRSLIHTSLDAYFLLTAAQHHAPPLQYFSFSRTSGNKYRKQEKIGETIDDEIK
ncbi:hypothetical protein AZE42_07640 [Rhizopogon vesiculosus]|uniref:Uncharacterized protein n=1 Tax=Rhizopogon vesiculosus TaxID=180088 RepID=A0A1J8QV03_9AGAM|nr:hypothetical protein AZE42_07640 [Rhizopogon vesiculosus]